MGHLLAEPRYLQRPSTNTGVPLGPASKNSTRHIKPDMPSRAVATPAKSHLRGPRAESQTGPASCITNTPLTRFSRMVLARSTARACSGIAPPALEEKEPSRGAPWPSLRVALRARLPSTRSRALGSRLRAGIEKLARLPPLPDCTPVLLQNMSCRTERCRGETRTVSGERWTVTPGAGPNSASAEMKARLAWSQRQQAKSPGQSSPLAYAQEQHPLVIYC